MEASPQGMGVADSDFADTLILVESEQAVSQRIRS